MSEVRTLIAAILLLLGGVALVGSVGTALNIVDDYQDSPDSTYLLFAGTWLVIAAGLITTGLVLILSGSPPDERHRRALGGGLLVLVGASVPTALSFALALDEISNDPEKEFENGLGASAALVVGLVALAIAIWQWGAVRLPGLAPRNLAAATAALAAIGAACVVFVLPPAEEERLAGAVALADGRAVGCTEQDDGWFYCRAHVESGGAAKNYVVTFDGECWITMTPAYEGDEINALKEIHSGCLKRRGVGRTRHGPGEAPDELTAAASRFLFFDR